MWDPYHSLTIRCRRVRAGSGPQCRESFEAAGKSPSTNTSSAPSVHDERPSAPGRHATSRQRLTFTTATRSSPPPMASAGATWVVDVPGHGSALCHASGVAYGSGLDILREKLIQFLWVPWALWTKSNGEIFLV